MNKIFSGFISVLLLLVALFLVNSITKNISHGIFLDLSEEKLFTLSKGSSSIVSKLKSDVTLKYFFSKTDSAGFPVLKVYNDRILGLLKQYERKSSGRISLEVYDPRPDSDEADWAERFGLQPIQLQTGDNIYFGLTAVSSNGEEKSLPVFDINNQEALEYNVSKLIYSLSETALKKVSILSSLDIRNLNSQANEQAPSQRPQPWFFVSQLSEIADINFIKPDTKSISEDTNVLVLIHPKDLSEETLFAIDQYVLSGKSLIVLVDAFCESDFSLTPSTPENPHDNSSNLEKLFTKWGIELIDKKVIVDRKNSAVVKTSQTSPEEELPVWIILKGDAISKDDVVLSSLEQVFFPFAGTLKIKEDLNPKTKIETLLQTSNRSHLMETAELLDPDLSPKDFNGKYLGRGEPENISLRISGELETAFPDGPPSDPEKMQSSTRLTKSDKSNVLIFSDVDFITDRSSIRLQNNMLGGVVAVNINDNLPLLLNSIDHMSGSSDLISIRSRGRIFRNFTKVEELEKIARRKYFTQENVFKSKLAAASQRLENFQKQAGEESQVFSAALIGEMDLLRKEKAEAQTNLRKVRRNLREDIESLGTKLFLINSVFSPLLVGLCFAFYLYFKPKKKIEL